MPSGTRYRLTIEGVLYDLSPGQYELLSKKQVRPPKPSDWTGQLRIDGLARKGLFTKQRNGKGLYIRTDLGLNLLKGLRKALKER